MAPRHRLDRAEHVPAPDRRPRERQRARRARRQLRTGWMLGSVVGAGLVLAVNTWVLTPFAIPSASMESTLAVGDRILVNHLAVPGRGSVVVFHDPGGWLDGADVDSDTLVKRVIGVGGDHVEGRDGRVYVNGAELDEPYLDAGTAGTGVAFDVTVPDDAYWVMGDNRADSLDSRFQQSTPGRGFVPDSAVIGVAFAVMWPPHGLG